MNTASPKYALSFTRHLLQCPEAQPSSFLLQCSPPPIPLAYSSQANVLKQNNLQPSLQRGSVLHRPASVIFSVLCDSTFMGNQQRTQTVIRFGSFEADLHTQELRRSGTLLRLPSQSFQVLQMLLERRGTLV